MAGLNQKKEEFSEFKKSYMISEGHILSFLNVKERTNKDQAMMIGKFY